METIVKGTQPVRPNFELKPGQQFLSVKKFVALEDLVGWLSKADLGMRSESVQGNYVFVDDDGNVSEYDADINLAIQEIALANHRKKMLMLTLKQA